jgi:RNA polymerase sigma-32 factor
MSKKKEVINPQVVDAGNSVKDDLVQDIDADVVDLSSVDSFLPAILSDKDLVPAKVEKVLDPLTHYLREISRYDLLSPEQEKALLTSLKETGDIEVAKKLVMANLRLVVKIAMEYRSAYQNVMDLIQEGNIGLMKAVSKYDLSKGAKLSYYASWWIKSYILKFILDNFRLVKIGTTNEQKKLFYNLLKEKNRLIGMGIDPDAKQISENLGVSEKAVITMDQRLSSRGGEVSIDTPVGEDSRSTLGDILPDEGQTLVEDSVSHQQSLEILNENLRDFVAGLKPRDQEIFTRRLLSEAPESLQSIANEYGVSRERIRQIESRLLANLKVYMSQYLR